MSRARIPEGAAPDDLLPSPMADGDPHDRPTPVSDHPRRKAGPTRTSSGDFGPIDKLDPATMPLQR